jgi:hypothetical protein
MNVRERVAETEPLDASVTSWLARFEQALSRGDDVALHDLFHAESYWRDILALTWAIQTVGGSGAVAEALALARDTRPSGFQLDESRTPPRVTTRAGTQSTEAFFTFETGLGRCNGVVRLIGGKAWTLMTALDQIKGHEERAGERRPTGESHSRDFRGRTGSINANPLRPLRITILSCWLSAADRPACPSRHASRNSASTR